MSDKPKVISTDVQEGRFGDPRTWVQNSLLGVYDFRAEVHRDDGSWSYGIGRWKSEAIEDAHNRLDRDEPMHNTVDH